MGGWVVVFFVAGSNAEYDGRFGGVVDVGVGEVGGLYEVGRVGFVVYSYEG